MPKPSNGFSWHSRRFQDTAILVATLLLICISLYHACTLREYSHQHKVRAKVLSRSFLNSQQHVHVQSETRGQDRFDNEVRTEIVIDSEIKTQVKQWTDTGRSGLIDESNALPVSSESSEVIEETTRVVTSGETSQSSTSDDADRLADAYPNLPKDFNWKVYLSYHPDLAAQQLTTKQQAVEHYLAYGQHEGRIYSRLSVLLRYPACGGLSNQLYSHIAAVTLAATLGAEAVLPPALTRSSFGHYFSMFKDLNQVTWSAVPLESILDVDHFIDHWRQRGVLFHKTPPLSEFPDMATPEVAYINYNMPGINPLFVTRVTGIYQQKLDLAVLVEKARSAVVSHAEKLRRENPKLPIEYIVLDLPCPFFMLSKLSEFEVTREAARSLHFAPAMVALGAQVVNGITNEGTKMYNGIHLRLESDSRDWSNILGGKDAFWNGYVSAIQQAGFDGNSVLYAATGLLTYGANDEMDATLLKLTSSGFASKVVHKEQFLAKEDLEGLSSEQKALVDFIVLTQAKVVVGLGSSTFSYYLREYRALNGYPKSTTVLVDASAIGTDDLFRQCGTIVSDS